MAEPIDTGYRGGPDRDEIELRSDNAAGVAPEILDAVAGANVGSALPFGGDEWTETLTATVRRVFDHPTASVHPVPSGTAANALALSAATPPWGAVLCHQTAHILNTEANATSLFSGGAQARGLPGADGLIDPEALAATLATTGWDDPHFSQPAVLSLTSPTDLGTIYPTDHVARLAALARDRGLRVHLDGARLANAVVALGCEPAESTWRAGVELLSLGSIKNGGMTADAIVCFADDLASGLPFRLKRAGHVTSKMRFQAVQLTAYLENDLWLRNAANANRTMARLAAGLADLDLTLERRPQVNMIYLIVDDDTADRLAREGLLFYRMGPERIRLVTSFQTTDAEIDEILRRFAAVACRR